MNTSNKRFKKILYLLMMADGYIRAIDIASEVGVNERTIKNDIKNLSEVCKINGVKLISTRSHGYAVIVIDEELSSKSKKQLEILFAYSNLRKNDSTERSFDLLKILIVEDEYKSLDDIANNCFFSKSTLLQNIKEINFILKRYSLSFKLKHEDGPLIKGKEYNRRMLMLELNGFFFHEYIQINVYKKFNDFFNIDKQIRLDIRHILLDTMYEEKIAIRDEFTQRISIYLCLMLKRSSENLNITFSESQINKIVLEPQFICAKKINKKIREKYNYSISDIEDYGLALQLIFWTEYDINNNFNICNEANNEINKIIKQSNTKIYLKYNIDMKNIPNYVSEIKQIMYPIYFQLYFDSAQFILTGKYLIREQAKNSPLAVSIAFEFFNVIKDIYKIDLSNCNILSISNKLNGLFCKSQFNFKPIRLIISSYSGLSFSEDLKININKNYEQYFEKINCMEMYEMRYLATNDFDFVILNYPYFSYRYDWPMINLENDLLTIKIKKIYSDIILSGFQLDFIRGDKALNKINIYKNIDCSKYSDLLNMLSMNYSENGCTVNIYNELSQKFNTSIHGNKSVLFLGDSGNSKEFFDIYEFTKPILIFGIKLKTILIIRTNFNNDLIKLKFYNELTKIILNDDESYQILIENLNINNIISLVRNNQ